MKLYILTSKDLPHFCKDDENLIKEFKACGIDPQITIWDEQKVPDGATVLIRTIWDYVDKAVDFKKLLEDFKLRGVKCFNSIETMGWNLNKSYLVELFEQGVDVVPTFIAHNFSLKCIEEFKISYPLVIKPLVGASGVDTYLLKDQNFEIDLSHLLGKDIVIQPYMKSIKDEGEISFVYFNNVYSHSVLKTPSANEFRVQEEHGGRVLKYFPTQTEVESIDKILNTIQRNWTYARVDVVRDNNKFYLMELELIEPELFFRFSENGETTLARVLSKHLF